ncbi:MAG: hypothetical protein GVY10_01385 [Verrucomicrobia bacterium]|jgi:hypothetical protein|nr:hypothetical protein [Verrucomicrobiota bacterium]
MDGEANQPILPADGRVAGFLRKLELWSLDPVLVALAWWLVLPRPAEHALASLEVLLAAVWLTYVADRLLDARPGREIPATRRHRYYRRHFRTFALLWGAGFVLAVAWAHARLPEALLRDGWRLVAGIVAYLLLVQSLPPGVPRTLLKRIGVAIIFTAGVALMSGALATPAGRYGLLALGLGALGNLIVISRAEAPSPETGARLGRVWQVVLLLLFVTGIGLFPFSVAAGASVLVGLLGFAWMVGTGQREFGLPARLLADGALVDMAITFALVRWLVG